MARPWLVLALILACSGSSTVVETGRATTGWQTEGAIERRMLGRCPRDITTYGDEVLLATTSGLFSLGRGGDGPLDRWLDGDVRRIAASSETVAFVVRVGDRYVVDALRGNAVVRVAELETAPTDLAVEGPVVAFAALGGVRVDRLDDDAPAVTIEGDWTSVALENGVLYTAGPSGLERDGVPLSLDPIGVLAMGDGVWTAVVSDPPGTLHGRDETVLGRRALDEGAPEIWLAGASDAVSVDSWEATPLPGPGAVRGRWPATVVGDRLLALAVDPDCLEPSLVRLSRPSASDREAAAADALETVPDPAAVARGALGPAHEPQRPRNEIVAPPEPLTTDTRPAPARVDFEGHTLEMSVEPLEGGHCPAIVVDGDATGDGSDPAGCRRRAALWRNVPSHHRSCESDDECRVVTAVQCITVGLNARAAALPRYAEPACVPPNVGMCTEEEPDAPRCVQGCCVAGFDVPLSEEIRGKQEMLARELAAALTACGIEGARTIRYDVSTRAPRPTAEPELSAQASRCLRRALRDSRDPAGPRWRATARIRPSTGS
ncbi:MAG: hypothetical protein JJ863_10775 [Deltaproteobacteria bacterium]|nr:hypothetical protein [Deltaproteobacteria bacterium]